MKYVARLALLLTCVARQGGAQAPGTDPRLAPGVPHVLATARAAQLRDVQYFLDLDVTNRDTATGGAAIVFTRRRNAGDVVLDFRGSSISSITVGQTGYSADRIRRAWNGSHVRIPAADLRPGTNTVAISFTTPIAAAGASIIRSHDTSDEKDYLYTLLVPSDASQLFPCFDQPDIKARITLRLIAPDEWVAIANGREIRARKIRTGTAHSFEVTKPLSTYLIAFAAGPYATITRPRPVATGAPVDSVRMLVRASRAKEAEADSLIAMSVQALQWLGDWFGVPYPFGKYDFVLAPAFPFGGMEHPGAVFYNEQSFIYRERPTASQLLGRQATIFHEVAHQWFGDYVTMQWFDDLWLKEGFATYMAAKMQAAIAPNSNPWKTFYLRNKPVAYGTDATAGTTPVWQELDNLEQAKSNYGPIVYNKAPGVLRQLNYLVGESAFQRGIRAFLKQHGYANATWRDLLRSVGTASGRDLTSWGKQWILRPGMPVIEQELITSNGRITRLALTQRPAQPALSGPAAWPMRTQVLLWYPDAEPVRFPVEMTTRTTEIVAARGRRTPAFVFANDGDYGYAIVLPDAASVRWLEASIGTVKDDLLRAMLWGALWDLVREARLSPARFAAAALRELPRERDEQIAATLTGRIGVAVTRYGTASARDSLQPTLERVLLAGASDTSLAYGQRKSQLDALIGLSQAPASLARLDAWLDADSAAGLPLRAPTRWAIVTRLVATQYAGATRRLQAETVRDSSSEGQRQAFVAGAATPDTAAKRAYYTRWFAERALNEEWVTSSLRTFHDPDHAALTQRFLVPSLDTLPWIQKNRRIFFLGSWLGAAIGGQNSVESLQQIDAWLASHPELGADLRRKVLQARDELERTVRIRRSFSGDRAQSLRAIATGR